MQRKTQQTAKKMGVYYKTDSYAGFWTRILAWTIDIFFLLFLFVLSIVSSVYLPNNQEINIYFLLWIVFCFFYLTVIKTTENSTLGFYITKLKLVNLSGQKPSFLTMTLRFLLLSMGPFELPIDLIWLTGEETKQTLRDKFAETYVIKKSSLPIGEAPIVSTRLCVNGWHLLFMEVAIPKKNN